jgi:trypsin
MTTMSTRILSLLAIIVVSFSLAFSLTASAQAEVGGWPSHEKGVVLVTNSAGHLICTGSIVAANKVLTAAHCISGSKMIVKTAHSYYPATAEINPNWTPFTDDTAILTLSQPVKIHPLTIATPYAGEWATSYGYGATIIGADLGPGLQHATDGVINTTPLTLSPDVFITASPTESLGHGDSGGPLVNSAGQIIGINEAAGNELGMPSYYSYLDSWTLQRI